jgi:hypothetical protein
VTERFDAATSPTEKAGAKDWSKGQVRGEIQREGGIR